MYKHVNRDSTNDEKEKGQYQDTICSEAEEENGNRPWDKVVKKSGVIKKDGFKVNFWPVLQHSLNPSVTLLIWVKIYNAVCTSTPIHRMYTQTFLHHRKQMQFWESNLWYLRLARIPVQMLTNYTNPPPLKNAVQLRCFTAERGDLWGISTQGKNFPFGFSGVNDCWLLPSALTDTILCLTTIFATLLPP